jgi:hypothetical protein
VLYITELERGLFQAHKVLAAIDQFPLQIIPATRASVLAAAHVKASYPISYSDGFPMAHSFPQENFFSIHHWTFPL